MSFLALPDSTSVISDEYENAIRASAVRLDHSWRPFFFEQDGQRFEWEMSADAVRLDGVRLAVTADFQRELGESLGGYLLTPLLCDALYARCANSCVHVPPSPESVEGMMSVGTMVKHSAQVDQLVAAAIQPGQDSQFVADACKDWVILDGKIGNYGWHTTEKISAELGIPAQPAAKAGLFVVQGFYTGHGLRYADYSQGARYVRKLARWNGVEGDFRELVKLPEVDALFGSTLRRPIATPPPVARPKSKAAGLDLSGLEDEIGRELNKKAIVVVGVAVGAWLLYRSTRPRRRAAA